MHLQVVLCLVVAAQGINAQAIFFPPSQGTIDNPTCFGSRLDKVDFLQNMYVQYAEYMADVPNLFEFHTCFWMRLDETVRTSTVLNYALDNNTYNDALTLQYVNNPALRLNPTWVLTVNSWRVYTEQVGAVRAGEWNHFCHSFNGRNGDYAIWQNGRELVTGTNYEETGRVIRSGGVLVTGQHQETLVDGMDRNEGIIGGITLLHVHSKALSDSRAKRGRIGAAFVQKLAQDCSATDRGDVVGWLRTPRKTYGGVTTSTANQQCGRF